MAIFNTTTPTYKTAATANVAQPAASTSGLTSLIGSLLGSATPEYKTAGVASAQAPAASGGLFGMLSASTPSYKTAPAVASTADDAAPEVDECGNPVPVDPCDEPDVREADEVVLL